MKYYHYYEHMLDIQEIIMSRPSKCRRVEFLPNMTYFKPAGVPLKNLEEVSMSVEEAEAIRLKDLEGLEQEQGAEKMNISRPTYQRILASARYKIADALLNGKAIRIEGGNFEVAFRKTIKDGIIKVAISATAPTLDADIDPRFGRCRYFIIVNPETMEYETLDNTETVVGEGAGIATAKILTGKNIDVVIMGNCGPNAYDALKAAGIKVITDASGKVKDAVKDLKDGKLKASFKPNVAGHFGTRGGDTKRGKDHLVKQYHNSDKKKEKQ
jgi:predicted DNA-binding protein (UPF0251 family)/predicted Fe-Mo cluster-binding NifX family protein